MFTVIAVLVVSTLVALLTYVYAKYGRLYSLGRRFRGPPALPIIGNALLFLDIQPDEFISRCLAMIKEYGKTFRLWLGPDLNIIMHDFRDVEILLSSPKFTTKSDQYRFLKDWLHDGLLLSHGRKYQQRRKLITPAFHFKMMEGFLNCFHEHSGVLVKQMRKICAERRSFELLHTVGLCMLDTICDTAMGVHTQAQRNADSEYVRALRSLTTILHLRMFNIKYYFDFVFRFTPEGREAKRALAILDDFAEQVILQRRTDLMQAPEEQHRGKEEELSIGIKRKEAFLDILLRSSDDGKPLSNTDIREEVHTFILAGHDTTSSALMFFFYSIITNPECERRCYEEICSIFGTDPTAIEITRERLSQLHYVDMCIKEALRMYPPIALIGRKVLEECTINDHILPAGANIAFSPYVFGRQADLYPEPNKFKPERFDLTARDDDTKPNPYMFTTFSGGPRSCLGSKYAVLQMKVVIVNILLNFQMEFVGDASEEPTLYTELTLRTKDPLMFTLRERREISAM
ncbi:PREDICTED: cytochrome P450 4d1-like [Rhagoletis zephyria]|uniref:cytochrome P450 4d1-like n=1 Tax=Rhagoletis zephyria TaxID=28612 RepID=UPI0008114A65|nr:PREDICTED: cytochrome P450 4d1-like [Rhagoletis zephyria]